MAVKIKFVGFWDDLNLDRLTLYKAIKKHYDVRIVEDPDYIICSTYPDFYEYCKYDQIRIMYSGENIIPDLNFVDYAVSKYPLELMDRHFYLPGCIDPEGHALELENHVRSFDKRTLDNKIYFANFIAGHESEYNIRGDFFKELSKYKRVESPGTYLNNMGGKTVNHKDPSKTAFQRKTKFTLCFESTKHDGFITEKITDAFYSDTIPVYYGSSDISTIFNPAAFINVSDYDSFDSAIERIIELDNDDDAYLAMLNEPVFLESDYPSKRIRELEKWVCHIFSQPYEQAYRRSRVYQARQQEEFVKSINHQKTLGGG